MKLSKVKKILPFLIVALILLIIIIAALVIVLNKPINNNSTLSTGQSPDTDPVYQKAAEEGTKQILASPDPLQAVAQLILKLPYKGSNFSLDYSYDNNTFTLTYKKGFETQGNAEFNQLLTQNNVDKKYLKHLETKFQ